MSEDQDIRGRAEQRIGTVLHGKYRLDGILGLGGMAVVYAATHRNGKQLAVKLLHPELALRTEIRTRFLREGYAANAVGHDAVVAILDDDIDEHGAAFLVMERLQGLDAQACCARSGGKLPLREALTVAHQLLQVLVVAHGKGVIHRDLKPANLFVQTNGRLKVLDFGIARVRERAMDSEATRTGALLGTPAFMAPELASAQTNEIDARSDLWAVGATLFTLLSGQHVHQGQHANQVLIHAATSEARSLLSIRPELPSSVVEVVNRALAFEKSARFQTAGEMARALELAHDELYGELHDEPLSALVAAALSLPDPRAAAPRVPLVPAAAEAAGPTLSGVGLAFAAASAPQAPAQTTIAEPLARPSFTPAPKHHLRARLGFVAALLVAGLTVDWYVTRNGAVLPAPRQAADRSSQELSLSTPAVVAPAALQATFDRSLPAPPPPNPALASPIAAAPRAAHAPPARRTSVVRPAIADPEPARAIARAPKNPLDVGLK